MEGNIGTVSTRLKQLVGHGSDGTDGKSDEKIRQVNLLPTMFAEVMGQQCRGDGEKKGLNESEQEQFLDGLIRLVKTRAENAEACMENRLVRDILKLISQNGLLSNSQAMGREVFKKLLDLLHAITAHSTSISDVRDMLSVFQSESIKEYGLDDDRAALYLSYLWKIAKSSFGPIGYFDLAGNQSGITVPRMESFPSSGYSFCAWIRLESPVADDHSMGASLFYMSNHLGSSLDVRIQNRDLIITTFDAKKTDSHRAEVKNLFDVDRWQWLCITHSHRQLRGSKVCVYLNAVTFFAEALPLMTVEQMKGFMAFDNQIVNMSMGLSTVVPSDALLFAYDARNSDRVQGVCFDCSANERHAKVLGPGLPLRFSSTLKECIWQLGGGIVFLPLLVAAAAAGQAKKSLFLQQSPSLIISQPLGPFAFTQVIRLIAEVLRMSSVNRFCFRRAHGMQLLALLLRLQRSHFLSMDVLNAIDEVAGAVSTDSILSEWCHAYLEFNLQLWINAEVSVQMAVFDRMLSLVSQKGSSQSGLTIRAMIRSLAWLYWKEYDDSTCFLRQVSFHAKEITLLRSRVLQVIDVLLLDDLAVKKGKKEVCLVKFKVLVAYLLGKVDEVDHEMEDVELLGETDLCDLLALMIHLVNTKDGGNKVVAHLSSLGGLQLWFRLATCEYNSVRLLVLSLMQHLIELNELEKKKDPALELPESDARLLVTWFQKFPFPPDAYEALLLFMLNLTSRSKLSFTKVVILHSGMLEGWLALIHKKASLAMQMRALKDMTDLFCGNNASQIQNRLTLMNLSPKWPGILLQWLLPRDEIEALAAMPMGSTAGLENLSLQQLKALYLDPKGDPNMKWSLMLAIGSLRSEDGLRFLLAQARECAAAAAADNDNDNDNNNNNNGHALMNALYDTLVYYGKSFVESVFREEVIHLVTSIVYQTLLESEGSWMVLQDAFLMAGKFASMKSIASSSPPSQAASLSMLTRESLALTILHGVAKQLNDYMSTNYVVGNTSSLPRSSMIWNNIEQFCNIVASLVLHYDDEADGILLPKESNVSIAVAGDLNESKNDRAYWKNATIYPCEEALIHILLSMWRPFMSSFHAITDATYGPTSISTSSSSLSTSTNSFSSSSSGLLLNNPSSYPRLLYHPGGCMRQCFQLALRLIWIQILRWKKLEASSESTAEAIQSVRQELGRGVAYLKYMISNMHLGKDSGRNASGLVEAQGFVSNPSSGLVRASLGEPEASLVLWLFSELAMILMSLGSCEPLTDLSSVFVEMINSLTTQSIQSMQHLQAMLRSGDFVNNSSEIARRDAFYVNQIERRRDIRKKETIEAEAFNISEAEDKQTDDLLPGKIVSRRNVWKSKCSARDENDLMAVRELIETIQHAHGAWPASNPTCSTRNDKSICWSLDDYLPTTRMRGRLIVNLEPFTFTPQDIIPHRSFDHVPNEMLLSMVNRMAVDKFFNAANETKEIIEEVDVEDSTIPSELEEHDLGDLETVPFEADDFDLLSRVEAAYVGPVESENQDLASLKQEIPSEKQPEVTSSPTLTHRLTAGLGFFRKKPTTKDNSNGVAAAAANAANAAAPPPLLDVNEKPASEDRKHPMSFDGKLMLKKVSTRLHDSTKRLQQASLGVTAIPAYLIVPMVVIHGIIRIGGTSITFEGERIQPYATSENMDDGLPRSFVLRLLQRRQWNIRMITMITPRRPRHILKDRPFCFGFELFLVNGAHAYFAFDSQAMANSMYKAIREKQPPVLIKHQGPNLFTHVDKVLRRKEWTRRWIQRELSNFDYLMLLNLAAGRSFNDLSSYPIFPWVLADFSSHRLDLESPASYRKLDKPMAAQTLEEELQLQQLYEGRKVSNGFLPPFHHTSYVSSLDVVLQYMSSIEPFASYAHWRNERHVKGKGTSIVHAYQESRRLCTEAIPEFYFFPNVVEHAKNSLNNNIQPPPSSFPSPSSSSSSSSSSPSSPPPLSNDLNLPPWANTVHDFIRLNRAALESEHVSQHLHLWIDLIFGVKQSGAEAVRALNVFPFVAYPHLVNASHLVQEGARLELARLEMNLGRIPDQLFTENHPRKSTLESALESKYPDGHRMACLSSKRQIRRKELNLCTHALAISSIRFVHGSSSSSGAGSSSSSAGVYYSMGEDGWVSGMKYNTAKVDGADMPFTLEACEKAWRSPGGAHRSQVEIFHEFMLTCGYWDGSWRIHWACDGTHVQRIPFHKKRIQCLCTSLDLITGDAAVALGSQDGTISVWAIARFTATRSRRSLVKHELPVGNLPWSLLHGHASSVTCVAMNVDLDTVASGSGGATLLIHSLRRSTLIHSVMLPWGRATKSSSEASLVHVAISKFGEIVVHGIQDAISTLFLVSLNGQVLLAHAIDSDETKGKAASELLARFEISKCGNYLVTAASGRHGGVDIREIRTMQVYRRIETKPKCFITSLALSTDERCLLAGNEDGSLTAYAMHFGLEVSEKQGSSYGPKQATNQQQGTLATTEEGSVTEPTLHARRKNRSPSPDILLILQGYHESLRTNCVRGEEVYESLIHRLWKAIYPNDSFENPSKGWTRMGFQRQDPTTDFRAGGVLSLQCLVYFAEQYTDEMLNMIAVQVPGSRSHTYPLCPAGINVNQVVTSLLWKSNGELLETREPLWPLFKDAHFFFELFSVAFFLFDMLWDKMNAEYSMFASVVVALNNEMEILLLKQPTSVNELKLYKDERLRNSGTGRNSSSSRSSRNSGSGSGTDFSNTSGNKGLHRVMSSVSIAAAPLLKKAQTTLLDLDFAMDNMKNEMNDWSPRLTSWVKEATGSKKNLQSADPFDLLGPTLSTTEGVGSNSFPGGDSPSLSQSQEKSTPSVDVFGDNPWLFSSVESRSQGSDSKTDPFAALLPPLEVGLNTVAPKEMLTKSDFKEASPSSGRGVYFSGSVDPRSSSSSSSEALDPFQFLLGPKQE